VTGRPMWTVQGAMFIGSEKTYHIFITVKIAGHENKILDPTNAITNLVNMLE
jgi:hypothetical protein